MAGKRASTTTRPGRIGDGNGEDKDNNGGTIVVYYNAGNVSDGASILVAVARAAVDAATAAANRGDDNAGCNEDPSACASPAMPQ